MNRKEIKRMFRKVKRLQKTKHKHQKIKANDKRFTSHNQCNPFRADDLNYYFSQVRTQAMIDGIKAIPGILRSYIPQATEAFLSLCDKYGVY